MSDMTIPELLQALEDSEYIKEIATPTTIPQKFGPPMKADIVESLGLEEDPNWIALKKALGVTTLEPA